MSDDSMSGDNRQVSGVRCQVTIW